MNSDLTDDDFDKLLELLSQPLTRWILQILLGIDPVPVSEQ
ncbi:MAG: hypothetical protein ACFFF4_04270 [Candidatus Thorarchaeota archaeon]